MWYLTPTDPFCSLCGAKIIGVVEKVPKKKYRIVPKPIDVVIEAESPEQAITYFEWKLDACTSSIFEAVEIVDVKEE
jgi:hypothetical protein